MARGMKMGLWFDLLMVASVTIAYTTGQQCSNCTNQGLWPRLRCITIAQAGCDMRDSTKPEVGPVLDIEPHVHGISSQKNSAMLRIGVSWEIPEIGYESVTGFLIMLQPITPDGPSKKICYHLDMSDARWIPDDNNLRLRLGFDCLEIHWETAYYLKIYSLPNQISTAHHVTLEPYSIPKDASPPTAPADWKTMVKVTLDPALHEIQVHFDFYDNPDYSFISYRVDLVNMDYHDDARYIDILEGNLTNTVSFYNVCVPGYWRAKVTPLQMANFICNDKPGLHCLNKEGDCYPCKPITSNYHWYIPENPCKAVPGKMVKQLPVIMIGICAGCLLGSALVTVAIYYSKPCAAQATRPNNSQPKKVKNKKVLLIYEEDHELHVHVIQHLATFLQQHCNCDVIFDQWDARAFRHDSIAWLLRHLDGCDKILVIHSEGGYKRYWQTKEDRIHSVLDRHNKPPPPSSPKFPLFTSGVEKLINEMYNGYGHFSSSQNTLSVYMPYTPKKFIIRPVLQQTAINPYELMKQIDSLVRQIHGVVDSHMTMTGVNVTYLNYHELAAGRPLKQAIDKMNSFVCNNPNWYSDMDNVKVNNLSREDHLSHDGHMSHEGQPSRDSQLSHDGNVTADSDYGTMRDSHQSSLRTNSVSSKRAILNKSADEDQATAATRTTAEEEVEQGVEHRLDEVELNITEDPSTYKDSQKKPQRQASNASSRVALLARSFEDKLHSQLEYFDKGTPGKRTSSSKVKRKSQEILDDIPEVIYAQAQPKSQRSSGRGSYTGLSVGDGKSSTRTPSEASRPTSCDSREPLVRESNSNGKDTPGAGRKSIKDVDAFIDASFKDINDQGI